MVFAGFTILIMAIIAYAYWREGPLTAFAMACNVLIAGLLAFNFYEPIADVFDPVFAGSIMEGGEDALVLLLIFVPVLMLLRWATNALASTHLEYPPALYRGGAVVFGMVTGYLLSGFLMCVLLTLPWGRDVWGFETPESGKVLGVRNVLPPDLVWLSMMHRLSGASLSGGDDRFDRRGNFELRYARYRRWDDAGKAMTHHGEMDP
jgi:hypothetical protein